MDVHQLTLKSHSFFNSLKDGMTKTIDNKPSYTLYN